MTITAQQGIFSFGPQAVGYGTGTVKAMKAQGLVAANGVISDGDTVTVGAKTYTFVTTLATANDVLIGTTIAESMANLAHAINDDTGEGTLYGTGTTANADVDAESENQTVFLTAKVAGVAGNSLALSVTGTNLTETAFSGGQNAGTYNESDVPFYRHRAVDINFEAAQNQETFPLEIGGIAVPTGDYKTLVFLAGGATLNPRLSGSLGYLLLGALGKVTTAANTPEAGVYTHTFTRAPNDDLPWMTVRKHIPGKNGIRPKGLTGHDCKVASLRVVIPQTGLVQSRVDFIGRVPKWDNHPDSWLYSNNFEDTASVPVACKGYFKLPTISPDELPVVGVIVEWVNNLTSMREEAVTGSYFMDDIIVRNRVLSLRFTYKWYDPELYERVYTGVVKGTDWTPQPFETVKSGADYAFEVRVESPGNIPGKNTPESLTIRASKAVWEVASEVRMVGGGILSQDYRCTVLAPNPGDEYTEWILVNDTSAYPLPTQS
jgi:hypothetical protein